MSVMTFNIRKTRLYGQTSVYQAFALLIFLYIVFFPIEAPDPYLPLLLSSVWHINLNCLSLILLSLSIPYVQNLFFSC